jgi:hypothetical protein
MRHCSHAYLAAREIPRKAITDSLVSRVLVKKGWFTPPFDSENQLKRRLEKVYDLKEFNVDGSIVYFCAVKR